MELLPEDRERLIRYVDFMESELSDFSKFLKIDWKTYNKDRDTRRNLERWIENIVNSSIDIAKVILALEDRGIPHQYDISYLRGRQGRPQWNSLRPRGIVFKFHGVNIPRGR